MNQRRQVRKLGSVGYTGYWSLGERQATMGVLLQRGHETRGWISGNRGRDEDLQSTFPVP